MCKDIEIYIAMTPSGSYGYSHTRQHYGQKELCYMTRHIPTGKEKMNSIFVEDIKRGLEIIDTWNAQQPLTWVYYAPAPTRMKFSDYIQQADKLPVGSVVIDTESDKDFWTEHPGGNTGIRFFELKYQMKNQNEQYHGYRTRGEGDDKILYTMDDMGNIKSPSVFSL